MELFSFLICSIVFKLAVCIWVLLYSTSNTVGKPKLICSSCNCGAHRVTQGNDNNAVNGVCEAERTGKNYVSGSKSWVICFTDYRYSICTNANWLQKMLIVWRKSFVFSCIESVFYNHISLGQFYKLLCNVEITCYTTDD
jgi:hypothetical protein